MQIICCSYNLVKSLVAIISCCIHSHRKAPFPFWSPHTLMASISWLTVCPALPRRVGGQIKKKAGRAVPCSCSQAPAICLTNGLGRIQPINEIKKQCITVQNKHLICYMMQFQVATALFRLLTTFAFLGSSILVCLPEVATHNWATKDGKD